MVDVYMLCVIYHQLNLLRHFTAEGAEERVEKIYNFVIVNFSF